MSDREPGADDAELADRAALVRKLNAEIRGTGDRFSVEDDSLLEFYCECGCWQTVELTIADYDLLRGEPVDRTGNSGY
jgi:hypothetical protein